MRRLIVGPGCPHPTSAWKASGLRPAVLLVKATATSVPSSPTHPPAKRTGTRGLVPAARERPLPSGAGACMDWVGCHCRVVSVSAAWPSPRTGQMATRPVAAEMNVPPRLATFGSIAPRPAPTDGGRAEAPPQGPAPAPHQPEGLPAAKDSRTAQHSQQEAGPKRGGAQPTACTSSYVRPPPRERSSTVRQATRRWRGGRRSPINAVAARPAARRAGIDGSPRADLGRTNTGDGFNPTRPPFTCSSLFVFLSAWSF
ncbi:hypothetical protein CDD83_3238 [Cordyceps sp. RAO-2017]|nr:hypothetical protein CDD83_3238 [Cordyceps sp. RAO-2017]